ncbi:hypothetical protein V8F06_013579 [Rhypophila decipiens]
MSNFKVIIVGGGPTGLAAAHCFAKAGIDYEILDRRASLDDNEGASAAVWPNTARVFAQLGIMDEALQTYFPGIKWKANLISSGQCVGKSDVMAMPEVYHGYPWMLFARPRLVDMLKRTLPGNPKIHTSKKVVSIDITSTGVTVHCADGSSFTGSIVLGADGINSSVRQILDEKIAQEAGLEKPTSYQTSVFKSSTIGVYGYCEGRIPGVEPETWYETHHDGFTSQLSGGDDMTLFLLYERLPAPVNSLEEGIRFTDEDQKAFVDRTADHHVTPTVTVRELMSQCKWAYMSHLEEGVIDNWYTDRIVLAGDSVAKMTPNSGFGINTGIQSVVAITNALRRVLQATDAPDNAALTVAFGEYETVRRKNVEKTVHASGMHTKIATWDTWLLRFVDRWIVPLTNGYLSMRRLVGPIVQEGIVLDWIPEDGYKEGTLKWNFPRVTASKAVDSSDSDVEKGLVTEEVTEV